MPPPPIRLLPLLFLIGFLNPPAAQAQSDCGVAATFTVPANTTVNLTSWYPSAAIVSNAVFEIGSGGTLVINKTMVFANCRFRCAANASITTMGNNIVFVANNTRFYGCTDMWDGITINPGTRIQFQNNCRISDAFRGLYFPAGYFSSKNVLTGTRFENNLKGIQVGSQSGWANAGFSKCWANSFRKTLPLLPGGGTAPLISGVEVTGGSVFRFGTAGGAKNIFEDLTYGIRVRLHSYLLAVNSEFRNMKTSDTPGGAQAVGILISQSSATITRADENNTYNCSFTANPHSGIFVVQADGLVQVEYANFSGQQQTGINYTAPVYDTYLLIDNNTFDLVRGCRYGIYVERPPSNAGQFTSYITNNTMVVSAGQSLTAFIQVVGAVGSYNWFQIANNTLSNLIPTINAHGIFVAGTGDNYKTNFNTLDYVSDPSGLATVWPEHATLGISYVDMEGDGNEIKSNTIQSRLASTGSDVDVNLYSFIKCGIHVLSCHAPKICSNNMYNTYRGIHFGNPNPGTIFAENHFHRHVFGAYFGRFGSNNTNIGNQTRRENTWSTSTGDYIAGGVGARYADGAVPFRIKYDPAYANHVPPNADPNVGSWFPPEAGSPERCGGILLPPSEMEKEVARGEYPVPDAASAWDMARHLWYQINRQPAILADTDVATFYSNTWGGSAQRFATALYQFEQAFVAGSALASDLDSLNTIQLALVADIKAIDEQINQDTTAFAQDSLLLLDLETKTTALGDVRQAIVAMQNAYATDRDEALEILLTGLDSLPDGEAYEAAWITILNAAIQQGKGVELDSLERVALLDIAQSCPSLVGEAWNAVVPFMPAEDAEPFIGRETDEGCIEERSAKPATASKSLRLFPNPAQDMLLATLPTTEGGAYAVFSATGQVIQHASIPEGIGTLRLDVGRLPSGTYILRLTQKNGAVLSARFAVVK